ncbi:MAG TPA: neprosin family prolyl endopeptidase [Kribbella sp.]|jgi:hypothetical protein
MATQKSGFTDGKAPVGVQAQLTVETPTLPQGEDPGSHSLAAMHIATTTPNGDAYNGVEVGWVVAPGVYRTKDPDKPHLFAFPVKAGKQSYGEDSCWVTPTKCGWTLEPGAKHELNETLKASRSGHTFKIVYDEPTGNWKVWFDGWIGHFEGKYWSDAKGFTSGDRVSWYGEVEHMKFPPPARPGACIQLGNGTFGDRDGSAEIELMRYYTYTRARVRPRELRPTLAKPAVDTTFGYNDVVYKMGNDLARSRFTYGGPGGIEDRRKMSRPC